MNDPYVYENGVLINKLNIKDYDKLCQAEADIGFVKLIDIDSVKIEYFDAEIIKRIHKHIFEDIFDWAGEYRTVPIIKEELVLPGCSIEYSDYKEVPNNLEKLVGDLNKVAWQNMDIDEISYLFARKLALIWRVHPFRDGNTRTILSFAYLYAKEHGFPFDMKTLTDNLNRVVDENDKVIDYSIRDKFVLACLDEKDKPEVEHLANAFKEAINNCKSKETVRSK